MQRISVHHQEKAWRDKTKQQLMSFFLQEQKVLFKLKKYFCFQASYFSHFMFSSLGHDLSVTSAGGT